MFGFGKKKKLILACPIAGKIMDITAVNDPVFSAKMLGDGFAVEPEEESVLAPCDGEIALVAETHHAVAIKAQGLELLIHVGIDTVELKGEGFSVHVTAGDTVKKGDLLLTFDRKAIEAKGKPVTTMVVITNMDQVKLVEKDFEHAEAVLSIEKK